MELQNLLSSWALTTAAVPVAMLGGQQRPPSLQVDAQKGSIFKAILDSDTKSAAAMGLVFWRRPDEVRTGPPKIAEGQLSLAPIVPLLGISTKSIKDAMNFYILQPK